MSDLLVLNKVRVERKEERKIGRKERWKRREERKERKKIGKEGETGKVEDVCYRRVIYDD